MARPSRQNPTHASVTSLRGFGGRSPRRCRCRLRTRLQLYGEWRRRSSSRPQWRCPAPCFTAPPWRDSEDLRLELVLQEASMDNKTIILTTLNAAWASPGSVIDLFIDSFRRGVGTSSLLRHLVIVAFDLKAYEQCVKIHPYCFALPTKDVDFSQEKRFQTTGYLEMMWKRLDFLRLVLEKGYSFVFSDADIMWFRNPFPLFYSDGDFQIACDHYVGNATDLRNIANGGFNYVKSNDQSIEFYKFWYSSRFRYPGYHDQDVFNFIKHDPYTTDIGLTIKFLSTTYFGGICEPSRDLNKVCTMHANCCIGLQSKIHDLRIMMEDWSSYMSMPPSLKQFRPLSWRVPQNCRSSMISTLMYKTYSLALLNPLCLLCEGTSISNCPPSDGSVSVDTLERDFVWVLHLSAHFEYNKGPTTPSNVIDTVDNRQGQEDPNRKTPGSGG
ncbi:unnamed protein product [Miscanthus lutarioriparius]|uniref:Glycosyltransferase n=1 Tax=Miscanthus lutarioriparius TaxID=422564 RepID=A0A811Q019_9POAL|nr:unnamed protein product [Miscanthus lutarioriparius]